MAARRCCRAAIYALHVPRWLRADPQSLTAPQRAELDKFSAACRVRPEFSGMMQTLFDRLLPRLKTGAGKQQTLAELLEQNGFDRLQHEQVREDLKNGRIGLAQNRLPASADIKDVQNPDVLDATRPLAKKYYEAGLAALVADAVAEVAAASGQKPTPKEMGLVMKAVQARLQAADARAEGRAVSERVKKALAG